MEMTGQYLTYSEYQELGGSLAETSFNLLEYEARKRIDLRTHKRLDEVEEIPDEVKICMFNLIGTLGAYLNENNRLIGSETVGSYSVDYLDNISQVIKNKSTELDDIIMNYLYGVIVNGEHIIYNGVR